MFPMFGQNLVQKVKFFEYGGSSDQPDGCSSIFDSISGEKKRLTTVPM
jgi:hypothetical protein